MTTGQAGIPISDVYKVISPVKSFEGKQKYVCFNCETDIPVRYYYLQCQKLCMFSECPTSRSPPHWGNTCPQIAEHMRSKKALATHHRKDYRLVSDEERQLAFDMQDTLAEEFVTPSVQGYNSWPFNSGTTHLDTSAVLDTGANSTYVNNRRMLVNPSSLLSPSVMVADGSTHTIQESGTLIGFSSIQADYVPTFTKYLIGVSPILSNGAVGLITTDKMILVDSTHKLRN